MRVCPECDTPQTSDTPFCENCGYRLRSAETALEGLPAISPEMLMASKLRRPEKIPTAEGLEPVAEEDERATSEEPAVPPGFARERRETEQENPAITRAMLEEMKAKSRTHTEPEVPASKPDERVAERPNQPSSKTVMEGMQAVERSSETIAKPDPVRDTSTSPVGVPAVERSGVYEFSPPLEPDTPPRSWKPLLGTLLGAVVGGLIGAAGGYFMADKSAPADSGERPAPATPRKIAIKEGSYMRGLDEEKRSLMIQTCYKVDDEPDTNCEQDKLLAGEFPERTVTVPAYSIDATEVTVAQYEECLLANACEPIDYKGCKVYTNQGLQIALRVPKALKEFDAPVVCLTRAQARSYCKFAGGDLPTHDQWERAARGDEDGRLFPWGDTWSSSNANWGELDVVKGSIIGKIDGYAWTAPPGAFPDGDSPFKLHDMAGNVAEWVRSADDEDGDIARGGSWASDPFGIRVTGRLDAGKGKGRTDVGVRCVYE